MAKVQKVYTKEFKEEAVKLAQNRGKSTAQIARELGVSESAIYQWQKQLAGGLTDTVVVGDLITAVVLPAIPYWERGVAGPGP